MEGAEELTCPFCGFKDGNDYQMLLHVEIYHSEDGPSPFAVKDAIEAGKLKTKETTTRSKSPDVTPDEYVECPFKCGERIPRIELQLHGDLHLAEEMALEDAESSAETAVPPASPDLASDADATAVAFSTDLPRALRNLGSSSSQDVLSGKIGMVRQRRTSSLKELFYGSNLTRVAPREANQNKSKATKRLGTAELGPYAHEKRMPSWLQRMLEEGPKVTIYNKIGPNGTLMKIETVVNETEGLVNVFARLSLLDQNIARAFYCGPEVYHVAKMKDEGGFCGYRNIQMLISYIKEAKAPGYRNFSRRLPSIIRLQDMIEDAWDQGYNTIGKVETGGIRLTRKYIGTSEAQALFQSLHIPCEVAAFFTTDESEAYLSLLQAIFDYFDDQSDDVHKVVICDKPPIYFQHKGHSMTIVGVEVQCDGKANLVVFDPMFNPSNAVKRLLNKSNFRFENPASLLKAHRRGEAYLSRYKTYETLRLSQSVHDS